jgi:hypothetical protein
MALGVDARRLVILVVGAGLPLAVFASRILLIITDRPSRSEGVGNCELRSKQICHESIDGYPLVSVSTNGRQKLDHYN